MDAKIQNQILASLPSQLLTLLSPYLSHLHLTHGGVLLQQDGRINSVYFPHGGVVSLVATLDDGSSIEVAAIGREGIVGAGLADRTRRSPMRAIVQIDGRASRMPADRFFIALEQSAILRAAVNNHSEALMAQMIRTAACNARHSAEARLCRWLLMVRDRLDSDTVELSQEFLGQMLGVQRTTVTLVAQSLQKAGMIRCGRARIEILDRPRLEAASCECYATHRRHVDRLMALPAA